MANALAKTYIILSAAILIIVGIAGFFRHEMFNLTFPPVHNIFHLASGAIGLWASLGKNVNGPRLFGLVFGTIYTLLALAGFAGLHDLGPIALGLNSHYNVIHLGIGLLTLAAGFAAAKPSAVP
jgi:hypothetical protein